jgi:hypothetical protein
MRNPSMLSNTHSGLCKTLRNLHLAVSSHEVDLLASPPPGLTFETLEDLRLDTSSAHGDNGTAIDTLLKACPNLSWPCDLATCQISNISWSWDFPQLRHLHTSGWNFSPAAYTDFLVRHPGLVSIEERVDGPYGSEERSVPARLPTTALPNLRVLEKGYTDTHGLRDYFDPAAGRPIDTLILHVHDYQGVEQELHDIAALPTAKTLRTLEFRGEIGCWRRRSRAESDSEQAAETAEERALC